jgi:hypothetical protein
MTGYSVSEVAHGELVNIRDRPELVELGAWKVMHMGWTDDTGRKGEQRRFEDIVLLLPDGVYGSGENGIRESRERAKA